MAISRGDVNEYIKEQVVIAIAKQTKEKTYSEMYENMGLHDRIAKQNGEILGLRKQIKELQEDIEIKDRLLSKVQVPAKWYDNIPERGVLCWCKEHEDDIKYKRLLERIDEYTEGRFLSRTTGFLYKTVQPLTNEEIEAFKR